MRTGRACDGGCPATGPPCRHNFLRARQHYYFCARCGLRRYRTLPVEEEPAAPAAPGTGRLRGFLAGTAAGFAAASCVMAALLALLRGW